MLGLCHLPFNCIARHGWISGGKVDLAPAVGADLEVMNRDAKKRLVIVVGLTQKKLGGGFKYFSSLFGSFPQFF